jgi:hypothetical protein
LDIEPLLTDAFSSHILLRNLLGTGRLTGQDPLAFVVLFGVSARVFLELALLKHTAPLVGCKVFVDCAAWEIGFPAFSSPY